MAKHSVKNATRKPTERQAVFVSHYCTDAAFNAALAYKMTYPMAKTGHNASGARLLAKVSIIEAINEYKANHKAKEQYDTEIWRQQVLSHQAKAEKAENWPAVAAFDRLLGQNTGAFEADNAQKGVKLAIAIRNEQAQIDKQLAGLKALDEAPDALVL